ncbi:MAG: fumarylacetoacetate hydrolase family protein [Flavobacteriales bacterium]|nr:fumarylacetoacetate hydrolase family protein [Flavobacteriales bacterium]MCW8911996.1 fumarylacetoacetate hydrolase family protein [Flavobacteriales bacterium]MCW8936636.1 fumarylacetoacetate hydrolase family protein [Flavobacteriales bacterium]MCW8941397.1 fumarylacetoacetate hydrolase family protein [Flavobacteriales bacterium]MCW8968700.1 fumarylacetoacetate hydrolase family protein [Flavobacteriales bacterium]
MKIICIGRNYIDHAKELNNPIPKEPVFFIKPDTALLPKRNPFVYPSFTKDLHYEVEIVLRINRIGKHIEEKFAHKYYNEIGVGVDFTARDVQQQCKEKGLPWEKAKAFDFSAPTSDFVPIKNFKDINQLNFELKVNDELRQQGNTKDMLFNFNQIIAYVSQFVTLKIGDYIYTGTPAGVGAVQVNDKIACFMEEEKMLEFNVK